MTTSSEILISRDGSVTAREFSAVLESSGLDAIRPAKDLARLQRMLDHADIIVTARRGGQLVGLGRAVTDFSWCAYLSDLAVDAELKGRGVGRDIIAHMQRELGPEVSLILASVPEAVQFYERIGMKALPDCFWIKRTQ